MIKNVKNGLNMITTVFFVVVITFFVGVIVNYSKSIPTNVKEDYFAVRGKTFQRSSIEYSIMALQAHDFKNYGCVEKLTYKDPMFTVINQFHYYLTDCSNCFAPCSVIKTKDTNGTVEITSTLTPNIDNINLRLVKITLQNL